MSVLLTRNSEPFCIPNINRSFELSWMGSRRRRDTVLAFKGPILSWPMCYNFCGVGGWGNQSGISPANHNLCKVGIVIGQPDYYHQGVLGIFPHLIPTIDDNRLVHWGRSLLNNSKFTERKNRWFTLSRYTFYLFYTYVMRI